MHVSDFIEPVDYISQPNHSELESECKRISGMSDTELLRFGTSAKFRCSDHRFSDDSRLANLTLLLKEARAEWNRRHSELPLVDSF
jgi:hypothetical protein